MLYECSLCSNLFVSAVIAYFHRSLAVVLLMFHGCVAVDALLSVVLLMFRHCPAVDALLSVTLLMFRRCPAVAAADVLRPALFLALNDFVSDVIIEIGSQRFVKIRRLNRLQTRLAVG